MKLERLSRELICIKNAEKILLNYPEHRVDCNKVNLHYYHAEWQKYSTGKDCNIGDYLSEIIVKWMCTNRGIDFGCTIQETKHLYAIGSILQMGYQNATIWGTGFAFELNSVRRIPHMASFRNLDVRCVRGPKTRKTLIDLGYSCPQVYGDPAILLPLMYQPRTLPKTDYLIIPHFSMETETRLKYGNQHVLSMNTRNYTDVIDRICSAEKVISSSLHGLIIAEAYDIPAVFYQDRAERFNYKYEDWYGSTGRSCNPIANVETGLNMNVSKLSRGKLKEMQEVLFETFPEDLWKTK